MFPALYRASWHCGRAMDKAEARTLVERCLPRFKDAGLEPLDGITDIKAGSVTLLVLTVCAWIVWCVLQLVPPPKPREGESHRIAVGGHGLRL